MADQSGIQWTDATWNPTTGCTKISPACANCYIERTPAFRIHGRKFVNGHIPLILHHDRMDQPLRWKRPRTIFVNSLSDLFHEDVPDSFIRDVFITMWAARQHRFQILTKRPQRMMEWVNYWYDRERRKGSDAPYGVYPHVWLGVSVENQRWADERIPLLLQTQAAIRFISAEPLLEEIHVERYLDVGYETGGPAGWQGGVGLDWGIAGGESGDAHKVRALNLDHVRSMVRQFRAAGVPLFVKQLGVWPYENWPHDVPPLRMRYRGRKVLPFLNLQHSKGGDPAEWPADLRIREYPQAA